jgi:hypothetical protein
VQVTFAVTGRARPGARAWHDAVVTMLDRAQALALLRRLDEPAHLEHPAGFDDAVEQRRFRRLAAELERRFGCVCDVEAGRQIQDASFLGELRIPPTATAGRVGIFVRVSNFGGLALFGADRPGVWDDADTLELITGADRDAVLEALAALDYVPLLEDVLSAAYDGGSDALRAAYRSYPPTWFTRYFDYL